MENKQPILVVKDLKQHFKINRNFTVKAVDGISFEIMPGETYGLVGESGSGKSTTGRSIIRLYKPTDGSIIFNGEDISGKMSKSALKDLRTNMQMIFQDPMACLNPRKKVLDIIAEGLDIHKAYSSTQERNEKVYEILELVGLSREHASRYPHQFSGGQRQYISDRIGVLHLGHLVETGTAEEIFNNPLHPYTKSLLSAIPHPNPTVEKTRTSLTYDYNKSGLDYEAGIQNKITETHYVLATEKDLKSFIEHQDDQI